MLTYIILYIYTYITIYIFLLSFLTYYININSVTKYSLSMFINIIKTYFNFNFFLLIFFFLSGLPPVMFFVLKINILLKIFLNNSFFLNFLIIINFLLSTFFYLQFLTNIKQDKTLLIKKSLIFNTKQLSIKKNSKFSYSVIYTSCIFIFFNFFSIFYFLDLYIIFENFNIKCH